MVGAWDARDYLREHFIPVLGSVEIWEFWNPGNESHPMHLHGNYFQILGKQLITSRPNKPESMKKIDHFITLQATETGWKDTVEVHPHSMTTIIIKFDMYCGKYPLHCHVLEHEDNEMMRQFRVVDPSHPCKIVSGAKCGNGVCEAGNGENCANCPFDCLGGPHFCCGWGPHSSSNNIGCGPIFQFHQGQCGVCQHFSPHSNYKLDVTCRTDFVDQCCYDEHHCDY
eukprot:TRINITY_DN24_c0_g1_i29.p1 TRINITY_DN24_c0_g1~~TRINITY_DN24_c0_g1_i29.p1  ORF type:complete len:240 (-),score=48.61 TRINITY_DN24_c0_g1_i29:49-726(-)